MVLRSLLGVLGLCALSNNVRAGGISIFPTRFNGRPVADGIGVAQAGRSAEFCFRVRAYSYGREGDEAFVVFSITPTSRQVDARDGLVFTYRLARLAPGEPGFLERCTYVPSVREPGRYVLGYSPVLMFASDIRELASNSSEAAARHLQRYGRPEPALRLDVETRSIAQVAGSTYLRLNGKVPEAEAHILPGIGQRPIVFSWSFRPQRSDVQFRHRLFPVEDEWSLWSADTSATYYYFATGVYQLQVVARVRDSGGAWFEQSPASYDFTLTKPLIAKAIAKGGNGKPPVAPPTPPDLASLYLRSRALLLGVTRYRDPSFGPLPYVSNDVIQLKATLREQGFIVEDRVGPLTRADIMGAIDGFVRSAERHERLVVYVSTHGFSDPRDPNKAYLVSSDCFRASPVTCPGLDAINDALGPVLRQTATPIQHLVLLIDACSAGLGVIGKAGNLPDSYVATRPGAHLITAGMADQEAEQDRTLKMSTFTYFLTQGLRGAADFTGDGVVSLSELLVYVRYEVARRSEGTQTPMLGRLAGAGEMIFAPTGAGR